MEWFTFLLDSELHAVDSGFQDYSFLFPFNSNERKADFSLWDSGFLELYFGFESSGFRIPQAKFSRIPDSNAPKKRIHDFGI